MKSMKQVLAESWEKTKTDMLGDAEFRSRAAAPSAPGKKPTVRRTSEGPRCPHCGSDRLHARRSNTRRAVVLAGGGVVAPVAKKNKIRCEVCSKTFSMKGL